MLAKKVIERVPSVEMVRFVSSGTEACLSVLRLMRAYTKREKVGQEVVVCWWWCVCVGGGAYTKRAYTKREKEGLERVVGVCGCVWGGVCVCVPVSVPVSVLTADG